VRLSVDKGGKRWCNSLSKYTVRREVLGSIPCMVPGSLQITYSFCPHSVTMGSKYTVTEMSTKEFPWG
jgi:hypothetical protein